MRSLTRYDDAFPKCVCVYVCVIVIESKSLRFHNVSKWKRDDIASVEISLLLSSPDSRAPSGYI